MEPIKLTFKEAAQEWLDTNSPRWQPTTKHAYENDLKHSYKYIGDDYVCDIKHKHIMFFVNSEIAQGRSKRSITGYFKTICCVLKFSFLNDYIDRDITTILKLPKIPQAPPKKMLLTQSEIMNVINFCHPARLFVLFMFFTGMRRGEALALQLNDIDIPNGVINVTKSLQMDKNNSTIKVPKTGNGFRSVPIPFLFITFLQNYISSHNLKNEDFLFTQITTGKLHTHSSYTKMWDGWYKSYVQYMQSQGKEITVKITAKMLRHTYGTLLFENDIADLVVQNVMGHADIAFTRRVYTHLRKDFVAEQSNNIRIIFENYRTLDIS